MKGLILSGGKGTRLRPLTYTRAKQLVPVANKPVLFYGIEAIAEAGIRDIGIIVGDTKNEIMEAVGDGSRWGLTVTYIEQEAPLGLAHAVLTAESYIQDEPFVMYLGDNLILDGIRSLVNDFQNGHANSQILLAHVPNPQQFGVAELVEGRVHRLVEKPAAPKSDLALVGVYMFDKTIFDAAKRIKPSARNELEITDAIQELINMGFVVDPHIVKGWWKDTGKLDDMLEANRMVLDNLENRIEGYVDPNSQLHHKVVVEKGAQIIRSTIRGPSIIGAKTQVIDSYIGPFTSIQHNCLIRRSEIEHSIVLEKASIEDIDSRIEDSLIGRFVEVMKSPVKPRAYRFVLGDRSVVGII
ncbi:glucose-1-phosphate thymidylyltransferase [bacterium]|nr:glucose-1-phosphate thymidylyltransferase [candidate division CSSED10-310 bacterium]